MERFEKEIAAKRAELLGHPIYASLWDLTALRIFMKHHVFAVWDFMSLLKALQRNLTCVEIPWTPRANPNAVRFINELVLAEESDEISPGRYMSHFELYLAAMNELGVDSRPILAVVKAVRGSPLDLRLAQSEGGVWDFMATTFSLAAGAPHEIAAAFLYGREDVIPEMFGKILDGVSGLKPQGFEAFRSYLKRHIELDGHTHGPLAKKLLAELCGEDEAKWEAALRAALASIDARIRLWTFVDQELTEASEIELPRSH